MKRALIRYVYFLHLGNDYLSGGSGNDTLFGGVDLGTFTTSVSGSPPVAAITGVTFGDEFFGGSGADKFIFTDTSGVDGIGDFLVGTDTLDVAANWFDGNALNGEFVVINAGGSNTFIGFSDGSADGLVDNTAIYLQGVVHTTVTSAIFV